MCPQCGTSYLPKDSISDENFEPTSSPNSQTKIMTPKKDKKYFDQSGNEINDEQLLKDMANGMNVISYREVKSGEDKPQVVRK